MNTNTLNQKFLLRMYSGYYLGIYIEIILSSSTHRELKTFILSYQFCKDKRLFPFFLILTRLLLPFLRYHIFCHILSLPRKSLLNVKQILCLLLLVSSFIVTFLLMFFYRWKKAKDIAFRYIDCMIQSIAYVWLYHFMCLNV